jgi:hypothetical protein
MKAGDEVVCVIKGKHWVEGSNGKPLPDGKKHPGPEYNELCFIEYFGSGGYLKLKHYNTGVYNPDAFRPVAPQASIDELVKETLVRQEA